MKHENIHVGSIYRVIDNHTDHGFDIGSDVKILQIDDAGTIEAISSQGAWFVSPSELAPIKAKDTEPSSSSELSIHKWRMIVDSLLDAIEDEHIGMGELMYKEIIGLYGYPFKWESKA